MITSVFKSSEKRYRLECFHGEAENGGILQVCASFPMVAIRHSGNRDGLRLLTLLLPSDQLRDSERSN